MRIPWSTVLPAEGTGDGAPPLRVCVVSVDCSEESSRTPMLAPAFLVAHARRDPFVRSRVDFEIRQFSVERSLEAMIEELLVGKFDLIGFSCYVWNYSTYEQALPVIRQLCPRTVLVMGGPQLQEQERQVFDRMPELDIVVYGAGELAFTEIVRQLASGARDWSAVDGILARQGGAVIDTSNRRRYVPFADIASPYLEGVITGRHPNLFFETYRGCPYTCAFCAWGGDEGPKADTLPLERIRQELDVARTLGARTLGFFDSNFNQPVTRAEQILDMILEDDQFQTVGMSVFAQTLRESLAEKMSRRSTLIGCGLQTSDSDVNVIMGRPFRSEKMTRGVEYMRKYGLQFVIQVIVGLPGDTLETLRATLEYALALEPPTIDAFRLMVLPGTEYRRRAAEFGAVFEPRPFHHIISHNTMSAPEINRAERMAQALTLFYNLESTRQEMFRQARENDEPVLDYAEAIGNFMETFNLFEREEMRKGDLVRRKQEPELMGILRDFEKFRLELRTEQEILRKRDEASKRSPGDSYIPVAVSM